MVGKRNKKATSQQFEIMTEFITAHPEMMSTKLTLTFTSKDRENLWKELTAILNNQTNGSRKDPSEWRRTWIDFKSKAKGRASQLEKSQNSTGEGQLVNSGLSSLQEKVLALISPAMTNGNETSTSKVPLEEITTLVDPGSLVLVQSPATSETSEDPREETSNGRLVSKTSCQTSQVPSTESKSDTDAGVVKKRKSDCLERIACAIEEQNEIAKTKNEIAKSKNEIAKEFNALMKTFTEEIIRFGTKWPQ